MEILEVLYICFFVFLIGICIGSFTNVVVLRAFSGESIVLPPSKCPKCNEKLKWYDNIPILSYIFLKGQCRFCKTKISIQYPIVEFISGVLYLLIFVKFGFDWNTLFLWAISSLFLVIATTDILEQVIFDVHTYVLMLVGLCYNFFDVGNSGLGVINFSLASLALSINNSFFEALIGLIAGPLIMLAVIKLFLILTGKQAFGEGDAFIAAGLGAVFGWKLLLLILFLSVIIQAFAALPVMLKKFYVNKNFDVLISLAIFILSTLLYVILSKLEVLDSLLGLTLATLMLLIVGLYTVKKLLSNIKTSTDDTYMAFGPAMVIAGFVVMFFGNLGLW